MTVVLTIALAAGLVYFVSRVRGDRHTRPPGQRVISPAEFESAERTLQSAVESSPETLGVTLGVIARTNIGNALRDHLVYVIAAGDGKRVRKLMETAEIYIRTLSTHMYLCMAAEQMGHVVKSHPHATDQELADLTRAKLRDSNLGPTDAELREAFRELPTPEMARKIRDWGGDPLRWADERLTADLAIMRLIVVFLVLHNREELLDSFLARARAGEQPEKIWRQLQSTLGPVPAVRF